MTQICPNFIHKNSHIKYQIILNMTLKNRIKYCFCVIISLIIAQYSSYLKNIVPKLNLHQLLPYSKIILYKPYKATLLLYPYTLSHNIIYTPTAFTRQYNRYVLPDSLTINTQSACHGSNINSNLTYTT